MAVTLYLVKSGQTFFEAHHRIQGRCDSPLTSLGIKQLKALREYFVNHDIEFDKAYCSTEERTSSSVELLTNNELDYQRISEIKEKSYGNFEGRHRWFWPLHRILLGGHHVEDNRDVVERMERGMNLIMRDAQDGDVILVVGHGDSMTQYLREILEVHAFRSFKNASFVKLEGNGQNVEYVESAWPAENVRLNLDEEDE